jgi:rhodanese-related sulfurtransferase
VAYNNGSAIFLDVRGEPYFSEGHIPGALLSTVQDLTNQKTTLDPQAWIIPY